MAHVDLRVYRGADSNFLAWWSTERVIGCLGYAAKRRIDERAPEPLTAYVPFSGSAHVVANPDGQPSTRWPFQRFTWSDFDPHPGKVEYQVVGVFGTPTNPVERDLASEWVSPEAPVFGDIIPYFNFGTVSSRWFSTRAALYPDEFDTLRKALSPHRADAAGPSADDALAAVLKLSEDGPGARGPSIADKLGGRLAPRIKKMLADAAQDPNVELYAALFELSDPDLIDGLAAIGERCHLILANGTHKNREDENAAAADALDGKIDMTRRMLRQDSLYAHNKFVVIVERGSPAWVWTGSANWSPHGLYTQSNNGLELGDPAIAEAYFEAWKRLRAAGDATPPPPDPPAQEQYHFSKGGLTTSVFFSPHKTTKAAAAKSPDLVYGDALIRGAKQGILSLMLDPGWTGSLLQTLRLKAQAEPTLYVRGVVNSDPSQHAKAEDASAIGFLHGPEAIPSSYDIVLPADQRQPGEPIEDYLGRVGIVVVHSKIIVIDPLGSHPVVMTGSHNMGVKAATKNDDNLVIVEGDRDLAVAYALNVMSVFNHFWWRHNMAPAGARKRAKTVDAGPAGPHASGAIAEWKGLRTSDAWQNKFYADDAEATEAKFWGLVE